ncbi:two component transcriptional regulator, LuxR family [Desulfatibacillum aliphaticivorans]|uniref:Two component transcriptional regulator, LuxR family n=1 Tax=Desulfatibacillum aliphaticivorans TaxID=218208 RepID=B8FHJ2_DESAL|nr:LuxR C-terminal-related transcriptional regulator [Desulfatibacillum aliphaticivorans]ACL02280.1 two component transcriptional regulator, LuxR family [Desulfatibacillum aliphaticivorans]
MDVLRSEIAAELLDALDEASQSVFYVIQDGKFVYGNKNGCRITGLDHQRDVYGKPALKFVHPDDKKLITEMTRKVMNGDSIHPFEWRLHTVDGSIVWVMGFLVRINFRGRPAVLGSYIDISRTKETWSELQETSRKLEEATLNLQLVREEERAQVGWEIQENLGLTLESLRTEIEELFEGGKSDKAPILHKIDLAQDALSGIWAHMNWREKETPDLNSALKRRVREFEEQTGIRVELSLTRKKISLAAKDAAAIARLCGGVMKTLADIGDWQAMEVHLEYNNQRIEVECICRPPDKGGPSVPGIDEARFHPISKRLQEWGGGLAIDKLERKLVLKASFAPPFASGERQTRILLGSGQPILREGIVRILSGMEDAAVVEEASTFLELMDRLKDVDFDLLLLDTSILGAQAVHNLMKIKETSPYTPVLTLTPDSDDDDFSVRMLRHGAAGCLSHSSSVNELIAAVHKVAAGRKHVSNRIAEKLAFEVDIYAPKPFLYKLSDRERQVMFMIAEGKTMKEIASELRLSYKTIATYRTRVFEKMHMRTDAQIVRYVVSKGLL